MGRILPGVEAVKKEEKLPHDINFVVPIRVEGGSQEEAALVAMRWLLDALLSQEIPGRVSVYPPYFTKKSLRKAFKMEAIRRSGSGENPAG